MSNDENHRIDHHAEPDTVAEMVSTALEHHGYSVESADAPRRRCKSTGPNPGNRVVEGTATVIFDGEDGPFPRTVEYEIGPTAAGDGSYDWSDLMVTLFVPRDE